MSSFFASPNDSLATAGKRPDLKYHNVWRDGGLVVISLPEFEFPALCVKTGRLTNLVPEPIVGAIGATLEYADRSVSTGLRVPVNADWLNQKKSQFRRGVWIASAGVALMCVSFFIVIFLETFIDGLTGIAVALLVLGALGLVTGVIYMTVFGAINLLMCVWSEDRYVWLGGACDDFVETLPDWKTTGPAGAPRR